MTLNVARSADEAERQARGEDLSAREQDTFEFEEDEDEEAEGEEAAEAEAGEEEAL